MEGTHEEACDIGRVGETHHDDLCEKARMREIHTWKRARGDIPPGLPTTPAMEPAASTGEVDVVKAT